MFCEIPFVWFVSSIRFKRGLTDNLQRKDQIRGAELEQLLCKRVKRWFKCNWYTQCIQNVESLFQFFHILLGCSLRIFSKRIQKEMITLIKVFRPFLYNTPIYLDHLWHISPIWFVRAHTCLYKVSQLRMHIRAKPEPWGQRNCLQSSETGLCQGTDLWKATKKCLQHLRSLGANLRRRAKVHFPTGQWP